ncbi:hypothetical protein HYALB_00006943 [Hymenoscyphus albidus]|uniref:Uncharacterized protein n=1 Tax=Hymenoscyphus albidus TaxID=595503 RepID=A0A9N9LC35_9HELO|nr:hypothetical protein HYALB_00006943 [Hymenoscyphus albidus]
MALSGSFIHVTLGLQMPFAAPEVVKCRFFEVQGKVRCATKLGSFLDRRNGGTAKLTLGSQWKRKR